MEPSIACSNFMIIKRNCCKLTSLLQQVLKLIFLLSWTSKSPSDVPFRLSPSVGAPCHDRWPLCVKKTENRQTDNGTINSAEQGLPAGRSCAWHRGWTAKERRIRQEMSRCGEERCGTNEWMEAEEGREQNEQEIWGDEREKCRNGKKSGWLAWEEETWQMMHVGVRLGIHRQGEKAKRVMMSKVGFKLPDVKRLMLSAKVEDWSVGWRYFLGRFVVKIFVEL